MVPNRPLFFKVFIVSEIVGENAVEKHISKFIHAFIKMWPEYALNECI